MQKIPFLGYLSPFPKADRYKSSESPGQEWDPSLNFGVSLCPGTRSDLGHTPQEFSSGSQSVLSSPQHFQELG